MSQVYLTDLEKLAEASDCLRLVAHPHRLRMLQMMTQDSFSVGVLAESCGITPAAASLHLRKLQSCGLLSTRREGQRIFYSIAEPCLLALMDCLVRRFDRNDSGS